MTTTTTTTISPTPSHSLSQRLRPQTSLARPEAVVRRVYRGRYRAGPKGVRLTWQDGSVEFCPAHSELTLSPSRQPLRIEGRLYRVVLARGLGYEAPTLVPD